MIENLACSSWSRRFAKLTNRKLFGLELTTNYCNYKSISICKADLSSIDKSISYTALFSTAFIHSQTNCYRSMAQYSYLREHSRWKLSIAAN